MILERKGEGWEGGRKKERERKSWRVEKDTLICRRNTN